MPLLLTVRLAPVLNFASPEAVQFEPLPSTVTALLFSAVSDPDVTVPPVSTLTVLPSTLTSAPFVLSEPPLLISTDPPDVIPDGDLQLPAAERALVLNNQAGCLVLAAHRRQL